MALFLKLYLAHLIADFILQFEELYRLKVRSRLGHFYHAFIHCMVSILLVFPYMSTPFMWLYIAVLSTVHFFQDRIKYHLQKEHPKWMFWCFTIDQIFHGLFIATILLFPISKERLGVPWLLTFNIFYYYDIWTIYMIAFIITTFAGSYFLHALRQSFLKETRPDHFITAFEILHGIVERTAVTCFFLFSTNSFVLLGSSLIGLLRLPSETLRSKTDFLLSFLYAALVGLIFRFWT